MRALVVVWLVLHGVSAGAETAATRVVIADPDPELRRAIVAMLTPWHLEIAFAGEVPTSTEHAERTARTRDARFVVWREGKDVVVFDRTRGAAEHRTSKRGRLDPAAATAAALSVKTLMRLPPPSEPAVAADPAVVAVAAPPAPAREPRLRVQLQTAGRVAEGLGIRATLGLALTPWRERPIRIGVLAEFGTRTSIDSAGFAGTWSDQAAHIFASYTQHMTDRWELEPYLALGIARSVLDGREMSDSRTESDTLLAGRAGLWARRRFAGFSVGPALELTAFAGAPTYRRANAGNQVVFAVPGVALAVGVVATLDLGGGP